MQRGGCSRARKGPFDPIQFSHINIFACPGGPHHNFICSINTGVFFGDKGEAYMFQAARAGFGFYDTHFALFSLYFFTFPMFKRGGRIGLDML